MQATISPAEKAAIKAVKAAGAAHGYGNMIAHLQTEWARTLMQEYDLTEATARHASGGPGYPFDWKFE